MKKFLLLTGLALAFTGAAHAQCQQFLDEGFESGTFVAPWAMGTGTYTTTVPSGNAPVGNYNLQLSSTGSNVFYEGARAVFTAGQPTSMSWWMRTDNTTAANGYVIIGDANIASDNGVLFCYFNATSGLRFFNSAGYNHPISANTWYNVEARNMNWTARTMDIYINNVLILTGWAFRSNTATSIDRVHLFSLSAANVQYDQFVIGSPAITTSAIMVNATCFGSNNGSATVNAAGGTGAFTYSWAPTGGTAATATGLSAGTYSCTVTDAIGCTNITSVTITEPTALSVTASQTNVLCNGMTNGTASVTITGGTPGYAYSWTPSNATTSSVSSLAMGSYTCTITDANSCITTQVFSITEPPQLISAASNSGNLCSGGGAVTLTGSASGGTPSYAYNWMPGNLSGATVVDNLSATTTYTLMVTDGNGCTDTSAMTVIVNPPVAVNLGSDTTVCLGMFLDAGNQGSTYLWNDGNTLQMRGITSTGIYYVTVTDINGCLGSDTVNVNVATQPNGGTISSSTGVDICPGDSVMLSSAGDAGTLSWWVTPVAFPGWQFIGTGNPLSPFAPTVGDTGTYQLIAIASNGVCPDDTSNAVIVIVHAPPMPYLPDTVVCGGILLDAGNPGSTYVWSDNTAQQQLAVQASGTYAVIVTDQFGCAAGDTANITVNPLPNTSAAATSMTPCLDDADVTLTGLPAGGMWTGPGVSGNLFDPSVGNGQQQLTYSYTDNNGCSSSSIISIGVNACVGVEEIVNGAAVNVYPNPNNGIFFITANAAVSKLRLEVTDIEGRLVYASETENVQKDATQQLDLSNENSGVYFLRITAGQDQFAQKVIIAK